IIYGPSGSGKSSLLNAITSMDEPNEGTIYYQDKDLYKMNINDRAHFRAHTMGIVYQTNNWVKSLSVVDNVALPLVFLGARRDNARKSAMDSLVRVGMQDKASKSPFDLSGGEQQRVAMARATVNNPTYIVADEPTGNLDSASGDHIIELLQYFNKQLGRTIVLVTHNMEYLPIGDQLLSIEDGVTQNIDSENINDVSNKIISQTVKRMTRWSKSSEL
ncbi:ABC transporter ATP-binding protein, partial [Candidatus Saccharibacteria bacterium]|nr:ABC transporter ATP-binding protein [Candidatus Saccharibacteria bacterium]